MITISTMYVVITVALLACPWALPALLAGRSARGSA